MTTYLISDLHLDESRPAITAAFYAFLRTQAAGAEALYILGDFFEVWVGDDDDSPFAEEVAQALKCYSATGVELYLMHGNRDFLLGEEFARRAGAVLLPDPSPVRLGGREVLLMHGDSLCTRDGEYMAFRQQARNPQWQAALLAKPLDERRQIAAQIRAASKSMNSLKAEDIMDVTPEEVEKALRTHGVRTLIHGHTHRPAHHTLDLDGENAERIVLGDWGNEGWCIRADDTDLKLIHWPITS
ncbi:UDP-2,3-diacylglucosamine hydrolase [Microbulbifer aestuariivivens]|uniref:UDP-2,3-diacylglucosamine hydrolase n=1 Tax=Microbulbifer aestuariivivens TaxID=1908308 RepID=A0ABP9WS73_9GAMM